MAGEYWQDREEDRRRAAARERDDFGQADYSSAYGYDPQTRRGYRHEDDRAPRRADPGQAEFAPDYGEPRDGRGAYPRHDGPAGQPRSWMARAGEFFAPGSQAETRPPTPRRGPSDRILWAVIAERLDEERGLDLRDVSVTVENHEVTLNGTVRHKADRRRIEDIADMEGVRYVQNNLRVRDRTHWTFF